MNVLVIAYYTAIRYLRNVLLVAFFTVVPILLIYVSVSLGAFTGKATDTGIKEKVGYLNLDMGKHSEMFNGYINSEKVKKLFELKSVASYEDGIDQVRKGNIDTFIFLDSDFSEGVNARQKHNFNVFSAGGVSVAKTLVRNFVESNNAAGAILKAGGIPPIPGISTNLKTTSIETKGKVPSISDAGSIATTLLCLFYCALLASYTLIVDHNKKTNLRFESSPVHSVVNLVGKSVGVIFASSLFAAVVILGTKLILNVNWNGNYAVIVLTLVLFLIIINNFGIIVASITKNIFLCGLATFAVNFFLVYPVMGTAFGPEKDTAFDFAQMISPHYNAYKAITGSIYSGTNANIQQSITVLLITAVALSGISFIAGRRKIR